jgi:signal transduction histidine kinase
MHEQVMPPVAVAEHTVVGRVLAAAIDVSGLPVAHADVRAGEQVLATYCRDVPSRTEVAYPVDGERLHLHLAGDAEHHQLRDLASRLAPHVRAARDLATNVALPPVPSHPPAPSGAAATAEFEHRLRTRLTVARGWVEHLRAQGIESGRDEEALAITSRQLAEIEDLLRARRPRGTGREHARPRGRIDLATAVRRSMRESTWNFAPCVHGPLTVGFGRPVPVEASELHDVLMHLLDNATEHTPADTRIEVWLRYEPETVRLSVEDAGPGFSADFAVRRGIGTKVVDRLAAAMGAAVTRGRSEHLGGAAVHLIWHD